MFLAPVLHDRRLYHRGGRLVSKSKLGRRAGTFAAAMFLAGTGVLVAASPAFAGVCGDTFRPSTSGGKAYWSLTCSGGRITMQGWVEDIKADGKCARVKGIFNNNITHETAGACPSGTRINFSWTEAGTIANGYLSVN
jgi:hypothetical protein